MLLSSYQRGFFVCVFGHTWGLRDLSSLCLVPRSYLTLCDPLDCSPPGSSVYGVFQASILEWGFSQHRDWICVSCIACGFFTGWASSLFAAQSLSCTWLLAIPGTAACQASLSFTVFWSLCKLMSFDSVMPSNHLIICCPLLLLPLIFSWSGIKPMPLAMKSPS